MNRLQFSNKKFGLKKQLLAMLLLLLIAPWANAKAGKILFVYGKAEIIRDAQTIKAKRGLSVETGDLIQTFTGSTAQIKLSDGTLVALKPSSQWSLKDYVYKRENPGLGKQSSELIKGGLRAVTGLIGKANPEKISYTAGTTTIGIRGTTFELENITSGKNAGVYVRVETGKVNLSNKFGNLNVYANQTAMALTNAKPKMATNTQVFTSVDEQIKQDEKKSTKLKSKQKNSQAQTSLNLDDKSKAKDFKNTNEALKTRQNVEKHLKKLDKRSNYNIPNYKILASDLSKSGLKELFSFNYGNNNAGQLSLKTNSTITLSEDFTNFMTSKGKFKGKGYKELKAAYNRLSDSEKAKLKALPESDTVTNTKLNPKTFNNHPLKFIDQALKFTENKVSFSDGNIVFERKFRNTATTNDTILQGVAFNLAYGFNLMSSSFTLPKDKNVYKYKIQTKGSGSAGPPSVIKNNKVINAGNAEGISGKIEVNFADKKFVDAKLEYMLNTKKYEYSGVKQNDSYIHDSGAFFLSFAENPDNYKGGAISGNFYLDKTNKNKAIGVFAAINKENENENHLGYLTFKKN